MFPPRRKTFDTNPMSLILNTETLFPWTCIPLDGGSGFANLFQTTSHLRKYHPRYEVLSKATCTMFNFPKGSFL